MSDNGHDIAWPVSEGLGDEYFRTRERPAPLPRRILPTQEHYAGPEAARYEERLRAEARAKHRKRKR